MAHTTAPTGTPSRWILPRIDDCTGCKLKTRVPCHLDELLPKLPDYDEICRKENT